MASVPLILDRIYKGIQEKVGESGKIGQALFKFFYDYKLKVCSFISSKNVKSLCTINI